MTHRRRLSVPAAAVALGVSEAAIRSRVQRGSLAFEREKSRLWVLLDVDESPVNSDESQVKRDTAPMNHPDVSRLEEETRAAREDAAAWRAEAEAWKAQAEHLTRLLDQQQQLAALREKALPAPGDEEHRPWWKIRLW